VRPAERPAGEPEISIDAAFADLLAKYDYPLAPEAIAQRPAEPRDAARLLVLDRAQRDLRIETVRALPALLAPGDLLVANDTRVLPARLYGRKRPGGGQVELLLIREQADGRWSAFVRMSGRLRCGQQIDLAAGFTAELIAPAAETSWDVRLRGPGPVATLLETAGHVPLPPYIRRADASGDRAWYQTVFAARPGAVAAPTAGLHFTPRLLAALAERGIERACITLHVGPGTFEPLRREAWERGELHAEVFALPPATAAAIERARQRGGRVVAVGTTTARVLEACAAPDRRVLAQTGETRLFIRPPYAPRVVDALLTNFHLPRTSLLMLVAAFAGRERVLAAYAAAGRAGFRFYSYGDAMLIL